MRELSWGLKAIGRRNKNDFQLQAALRGITLPGENESLKIKTDPETDAKLENEMMESMKRKQEARRQHG